MKLERLRFPLSRSRIFGATEGLSRIRNGTVGLGVRSGKGAGKLVACPLGSISSIMTELS